MTEGRKKVNFKKKRKINQQQLFKRSKKRKDLRMNEKTFLTEILYCLLSKQIVIETFE